MSINIEKIFEKFSALLFLILLVSLVLFLTYVPIPEDSKQVILIIIGGLMSTAATALPRMFGVSDERKALKHKLELLEVRYAELKRAHDFVQELIVNLSVGDPDDMKLKNAIARTEGL